jgi:hypothetical protein
MHTMDKTGVTLQINLAPTDLPHAKYTLPHQLRQWADQVDEIVLVVDLHRSRGRYSEAWQERLPGFRNLIAEYCAKYAKARTVDVDYSTEVATRLSKRYFGGEPIPAKDWNGGPFYAYFFGLDAAKYNYVLHMDADMLYGGGSTNWVTEGVNLLVERPDVLICSPIPGPPTADGLLRSQFLASEPFSSLAYRASSLSTRHFLLDQERFFERIQALTLTQPPRRRIWQAQADGNPPYNPAEEIFSQAMEKQGLLRIEFLGHAPGMWSIHPPYRSKLFYDLLPTLIQQIETGNIPEAQRGCHDMNDSMVDWSSTRKSVWQRGMKHLNLFLQYRVEKIRYHQS